MTVAGRPHHHLLFQLILSRSGWRYAEVTTGETFLALKQGLQTALWELGGVPEVARSDNTSVAHWVPAVEEWGLVSEPWTFVVDCHGLVAAKFEQFTPAEDMEAALLKTFPCDRWVLSTSRWRPDHALDSFVSLASAKRFPAKN